MSEFKVGDAVKHSDKDYDAYFYRFDRDEIGEIVAVDIKSRYPISVNWPHVMGDNYPHLEEEIVLYDAEEN